jgi:nitric oxide reductase NorQ protein
MESEPCYEAISDEIEVFEAAYQQNLPILLEGPMGCGKTRFMEHVAWRVKKPLDHGVVPRRSHGVGFGGPVFD